MAVLRRHGYKGEVAMDETGAIPGTPVVIASLNGWTLDMARDRVDVTAFGDTNKVYVQGLSDIKGTVKGWWEAIASRPLIDVAMGDAAVTLKLTPSTLDATTFFQGLAYLDASVEVAADGAVSISGSFGAAGPWSLEPAGVMLGAPRVA
jgi:hypothetical protein